MKIESINVSLTRQVEYHGERVATGIFKKPTADPVQVTSDGITGDRQCDRVNHGGEHKAVYGFSLGHYEHWRKTLGLSRLEPGAFGENLTVSNLDEEAICIGDQLAAGEVILEVCQPRVPCFKLGIALGDERAPSLFTRHFHTGMYFRVLRPGTISPGDNIDVTRKHPAGISVYQLFRAYYDKSLHSRSATLEAAAGIAELAPEWQERVR